MAGLVRLLRDAGTVILVKATGAKVLKLARTREIDAMLVTELSR